VLRTNSPRQATHTSEKEFRFSSKAACRFVLTKSRSGEKHKAAEVVVSFMQMLSRIGATACDGPAENPQDIRPTP
jgi:hypothetical protein